jgi:hypothetical protein
MRLAVAILLGSVCGFAFLMLAGATLLGYIGAVGGGWLLTGVFIEAFGAYNGTSRAAHAARTQDSRGGARGVKR